MIGKKKKEIYKHYYKIAKIFDVPSNDKKVWKKKNTQFNMLY